MSVSSVTLLFPVLLLVQLILTWPTSSLLSCVNYVPFNAASPKTICFPSAGVSILDTCKRKVQSHLSTTFNILSDLCVEDLCETCMLSSTSQNGSVCCRNGDQFQLNNSSILSLLSGGGDDILTCVAIMGEHEDVCDALENITSKRLLCGLELSRRLVDTCVFQLSNSCKINSCENSLFFDRTFCLSPINNMICGQFCRFGGPKLSEEYEQRLTENCMSFLQFRPLPLNGNENFLLTSSLLRFASDLSLDIINFIIGGVLGTVSRLVGGLSDETILNILDTLDIVFDDSFAPIWQNVPFSTTVEMVSLVNNLLLLITEGVANDTDSNSTFMYRGRNIVFDVVKFQRGETASNYTFPPVMQDQNNSLLDEVMVTIPFNSPCNDSEDDDDCFVAIGISIIDNFAEYITQAIRKESMDNNTIQEADSALVSVVAQNTSHFFTDFVNGPVVFQFIPQGNVSFENFTYEGNFLDTSNSSLSWSSTGLTTMNFDGRLEVTSDHLTSFAILASPTGYVPDGIEGVALKVVSYIGCGVSIFSLSFTIVLLLLFGKKLNKGVLLYVHLNFAISLLLAMVLFIAGVNYASFNRVLCIVTAAVLQYLFLCAFMWMLGEGVMLYLLIVKVFGQASLRWYILLPVCWGIPVPLVAIAAGILRNNYIIHNTDQGTTYCWIDASPTKATIWTFLVPLIIIICVNASILLITVISIVRTRKRGSSYRDKEFSNLHLAKTAVKGSLILLPLLGLTWVFGLFAVNTNTSVFSWLFTIINSLQGLFFFLIHVVRNDYVLGILKDSTKKLCCRGKQKRASLVRTSGTASTEMNGKSSENISLTRPSEMEQESKILSSKIT